jgi:hypothetical protein
MGPRHFIHQREVGMTRTDLMASSRPLTAGAPRGGSRAGLRHALLVLPVALLVAFALMAPSVASAAGEPTSGYTNTPSTPTTTPSTPTTTPTPTTTKEPTTGTSPSKEEKSTPASAEEPTKSTTTSSPKSSKATLPFTGFDLRWTVAIGLLLMGAGFSIVVVQRRQQRGRSR